MSVGWQRANASNRPLPMMGLRRPSTIYFSPKNLMVRSGYRSETGDQLPKRVDSGVGETMEWSAKPKGRKALQARQGAALERAKKDQGLGEKPSLAHFTVKWRI